MKIIWCYLGFYTHIFPQPQLALIEINCQQLIEHCLININIIAMNRYILLLVAICALSTLAFGQRSKILNIATAGYVEQSKPDQAVSSSATNALLCKGKSS
jgi:hypothetical protein